MFASERGIDEMDFSAVQKKVHSLLMERLDLRQMEKMEEKLVRNQIRLALRDLIDENGFVLNEHEQSVLIENVENEVLGMGPLEPLLHDPSISDILINTADTCYIERHGVLEKVQEEVGEVLDALAHEESPRLEEELGDLLFAVVNLVRLAGSHSATALSAAP